MGRKQRKKENTSAVIRKTRGFDGIDSAFIINSVSTAAQNSVILF